LDYLIFFLEEFLLYFEYVRSLQYDESPKYEYLKNLFKGLMKKNEFKNDYNFDWCENKKNKSSSMKVKIFFIFFIFYLGIGFY